MKKILLIPFLLVLLGCYGDPLFYIRRLSKSDDIEKKMEASRQYDEVITILVESYSSFGGLNKDIGRRLMMNRNYSLAIKHLEIAKDVRINDSSIYYWLAVCYVNLYKIENKRDYLEIIDDNYQKSLNITPNNKEVLYAYSQFLIFGNNNYLKAIEILKKYIVELKSAPHPDAYFLLARAHYLAGNFTEAQRVYNEIYSFEKNLTKEQKEKLEDFIRITKESISNEP